MIQLSQKDIDDMLAAQKVNGMNREQLAAQARAFLYNNQECYVAQWVLQNPFANISDYRLKFVYNDHTLMGYTVEMEKIENV